MNFNLKTPCSSCPFRTNAEPYLTKARAKEISQRLLNDQSFICHKTIDKKEEHCAGAMIILEKLDKPNQMMRIAERFRDYDRNKLDMLEPVFDNFKQFINAQED